MKNSLVVFTAVCLMASCLTLQSCGESKFNAEISSMDTLAIQLDSIEDVLVNIDRTQLETINEKVKENLLKIQRYLIVTKDTLPHTTTIYLQQYRQITRSMRNFNTNYHSLLDQVAFSRGQLEDLKKDLIGNDWSKEEVEKHCSSEQKAIDKCRIGLRDMMIGIRFATEQFDDNNEKVEKIVNQITHPENEDPNT